MTTPALRPLRPETQLATPTVSPHARILAALSRVVRVRVPTSVRTNGHRFYVVELDYGAIGVASTAVQWRFSAFLNLRDELYYHIRRSQRDHAQPCAFCQHARTTLDNAPAPPPLHRLMFAAPDAICQQLQAFLAAALALAQSAKQHRDVVGWGAHAVVPLLVKRFLWGDQDTSDVDETLLSRRSAVDPFRPVAAVGLAFS